MTRAGRTLPRPAPTPLQVLVPISRSSLVVLVLQSVDLPEGPLGPDRSPSSLWVILGTSGLGGLSSDVVVRECVLLCALVLGGVGVGEDCWGGKGPG